MPAQTDNFFELLCDGNMSLMRAVEKFDYSRGNKFSTYASWAIMKNFARSHPGGEDPQGAVRHGPRGTVRGRAGQPHRRARVAARRRSRRRSRVNRLLEHLDPRDREIIRLRAGLDGSEPNDAGADRPAAWASPRNGCGS